MCMISSQHLPHGTSSRQTPSSEASPNRRRSARRTAGGLLGVVIAAAAVASPAWATEIASPGGGETLKVMPGDTVLAGYDFTIAGNSTAVTVKWSHPTAVFNFTCANGRSGSFTIAMPDYTVTVSDSKWYPTGDQHNALAYQGSIVAPDGCGDGTLMKMRSQGIFTADASSSPAGRKVNYRFHNSNNTSGSWSSTKSVITSELAPSDPYEL